MGTIVVIRGPWHQCAACGGWTCATGPHAPMWRRIDGEWCVVDCVGHVVRRGDQ